MSFFCSVRTGSPVLVTFTRPSNNTALSSSLGCALSLQSFFSPPQRLSSTRRRFYSGTMPKPTTTKRPPPVTPRPSSSVVLLSPTNQVLLLKRVQTSSSFASAHVFPGGNLDAKHDGDLGDPSDLERYHRDCGPYRMAAIRETFEETGILLAFDKNGEVLSLPEEVREQGRMDVHAGRVGFGSWVEGLGGRVDVDGLVPFTRWITPPNLKKRFTTQMYIYMMPLGSSLDGDEKKSTTTVVVPTHDGGLEHTELAFDDIGSWLEQAKRGKVTLYPPQFYILSVLEPFFAGPQGNGIEAVKQQRERFLEFVENVPTSEGGKATEMIPWKDKAMSPMVVGRKEDERLVMGLDKPGPELERSGRGGDGNRRIVVRFGKEGPSELGIEVKVGGAEKKARL